MEESQFWSMVETAWQAVSGKVKERRHLATGSLSEDRAEELVETVEEFIPALRVQLEQLSAEELLGFDRILERKLYDIDRAEIQERTDGSNDGFLYCRGFIVAAGQAYYNAVNTDPDIAMMDLECEEMCYISLHLYEGKFGRMPASGISRESCQNRAAWPDLS
jgi:hypothetical protein